MVPSTSDGGGGPLASQSPQVADFGREEAAKELTAESASMANPATMSTPLSSSTTFTSSAAAAKFYFQASDDDERLLARIDPDELDVVATQVVELVQNRIGIKPTDAQTPLDSGVGASIFGGVFGAGTSSAHGGSGPFSSGSGADDVSTSSSGSGSGGSGGGSGSEGGGGDGAAPFLKSPTDNSQGAYDAAVEAFEAWRAGKPLFLLPSWDSLLRLERVGKQWEGALAKASQGVEFYVLGTRLLGDDIQYAGSLLQKAALQGTTLSQREARTLRRTAKDLVTVVPVIVILVIPLTPIGHVLVFSFIQRIFPDFFPSTYTERRQNLFKLYEAIAPPPDQEFE